jgi:uncharacterized membrane protein YjgN (DUF898 family)
MITHTSSLSSPMPISPLGERSIQGAAPSTPKSNGTIESSPIEFSGTSSEYFRIWIVNLLLIMVTLGIYYPWAKVRKIKYFYNNTHISGHALDFHADPKKMLRGAAIVGVFFLLYSFAVDFSPVTGLVAVLAIMALAPPLFNASMRFRLANTSWRGMRFRFVAKELKEAYWCIAPPLALFLLPGLILAFLDGGEGAKKSTVMPMQGSTVGLYVLVLAIAIPYFFWRLKRYQHNHFAWGPLKSEYRSEVAATYKVFGLTLSLILLMTVVIVVLMVGLAILIGGMGSIGGKFNMTHGLGSVMSYLFILIPLLFLFAIAINIAPRAYFTSTMQNLIWSRTGNRHFRFKSDLATGRFMGLQFKNYLLIMITLGLYWPFAVVATKRMQLEAVSLKTRVSLDALSDAARARENDAAGDMAADIFGFDIGL